MRPRRFFIGIALMLAVWATTVSAAGLGSGQPASLPDSWHIPEHLIGDRGRYTVTLVEQDGDDVRILGDEAPLLDFAWLEPTFRIDLQGESHHVWRLATVPYGVGDDAGVRYAAPIYEFDSSTGELISYTYESGDIGSTGQRSIHFVAPDQNFVPACGLQTPLAGKEIDPAKAHVLFPQCSWHAYWAPKVAFTGRALDTLGNQSALYFERSDLRNQNQDMHLWLSPDHPYPLRFAIEDQDRAGRFYVIRLANFERGDAPLVSATPPAGPGPIRWVEFDGSLPPGPSGHPFSARTAFAASIAHEDAQDLRDHFDAYPDAYVAWTYYDVREVVQGGETSIERTWTFYAADGPDSPMFAWSITRTREAPDGVPAPLADLLAEDVEVYTSEPRASTTLRAIPVDRLPDQIPDPAWLLAAWQATRMDPDLEVGWQIRANCQDAACDDASLDVGYGGRHDLTIYDEPTPTGPGNPVVVISEGHLLYDIDPLRGNGMDTREFLFGDCSEGCSSDGVAPTGFATSSGDPHAVVHYDIGLWGFPSAAVVAGTGVASLLVTLIYWTWPALKSGLLAPLFSRIQGPQVAQHPRRQAILDVVGAEPGISLRRAQGNVGGGRGAFDHHVRKLADAGLLKCVPGQGHTALFLPHAADHKAMQARAAVSSPQARAFLEAVAATPGASLSQLARGMGLSPSTVHHHVQRLKAAGLLDVQAATHGKRIYVTATGEQARGVA